MAYYTPYIIGQYNLLYTANFEKHCWQVAESARYLIGRASVSKLKFACLTLTHRDPKTKTPPKNTKRNMMKHVFFLNLLDCKAKCISNMYTKLFRVAFYRCLT